MSEFPHLNGLFKLTDMVATVSNGTACALKM
jgi:hypothetical protein